MKNWSFTFIKTKLDSKLNIQTKSNVGNKTNYLFNFWKTEEENYVQISNILLRIPKFITDKLYQQWNFPALRRKVGVVAYRIFLKEKAL